jgi:hypothetical protein
MLRESKRSRAAYPVNMIVTGSTTIIAIAVSTSVEAHSVS